MDGAEHTSWTMIDAAAKGRADERESIARIYAPLVRRYLAARWRLSPEHEQVSEGVQDAMLQLFKPGGALQNARESSEGGFRAYLYGLVRNVALMIERSARRRSDRRDQSGLDLDQIEQDEATLSQAFDRSWARMIAQRARLRMADNVRRENPRSTTASSCATPTGSHRARSPSARAPTSSSSTSSCAAPATNIAAHSSRSWPNSTRPDPRRAREHLQRTDALLLNAEADSGRTDPRLRASGKEVPGKANPQNLPSSAPPTRRPDGPRARQPRRRQLPRRLPRDRLHDAGPRPRGDGRGGLS
jgi:DNA-directed RNA polymerase specialized sigma24 family protein